MTECDFTGPRDGYDSMALLEEASVMAAATHSRTDCRSEAGITVGMIDGIIAMARVLRKREMDSPEILEALRDIRADEDVAWLLAIDTVTSK